ncbi:tetratricopeptide repeat protein [Candidatus Altiarchaeota archaeon]
MDTGADGYRSVSSLIDAGDTDSAIEAVDKILVTDPTDYKAWILKAAAFESQGNTDAALWAYDKACEGDGMFWPYLRKAQLLHRMERFDEAVVVLDEGLLIDPGYPGLWEAKGLVLEDLTRPDDALECFGRALALDDSYGWSWFGLARMLVYADALDQALAACDKALTLVGDDESLASFRDYVQGKRAG